MIEQDYLLLIMNCQKYRNKAELQRCTWLTSLPKWLTYYHVIGDEQMNQPYEFDDENRILIVNVKDDYVSLPKKVIAAYNAVNEAIKFKYIFKTDDDQMLTKLNFFDILSVLIQKKQTHYGGYIVNVNQPYLSQYHKIHPELPQYIPILKTVYCSGRFYFLSKEAVDSLIVKREYIEKECLEDYAIGYNLHDMFKTDILSINTNELFKDMETQTITSSS
jgi:hypothetical protein